MKKYEDITFSKLDSANRPTVSMATQVVGAYYSSDEFENFVLEWLKYCKKKLNTSSILERVGGTGDYGVDIYEKTDGKNIFYQCKKYNTNLTEPQVIEIIVKILWYSFKNKLDFPDQLFIIAYKGINKKAITLLNDTDALTAAVSEKLKESLSANKISYTKIEYSEFAEYIKVKNIDFVKKIDLDEIVKDYCLSEYCTFRFLPMSKVKIARVDTSGYSYSDAYLTQLEKIVVKRKKETILNAKRNFYSATSLKETDKYLFGDNEEFEKLYAEVENNIENIRCQEFHDLEARFRAISDRAMSTITSNNYFEYNLHMIGSEDKAGVCHIMVNDDKLSWEAEDE